MREALRRPLGGAIVTLGRQDVLVSGAQLQRIARTAGFASPVDAASLGLTAGAISDEVLLRYLGFDEIVSLDVSAYEGAGLILDLNEREIPDSLVGHFDVVLDSGTLEHVFHVPNALRSVVRMLKPDGRVIHIAPSSNHMDHGFYMFSPTLLADYYRANDFQIESLQVLRYTQPIATSPWLISDYPLDRPSGLDMGQLDSALYAVICIATKGAQSTGDVVPQQSAYVRVWAPSASPAPPVATPLRAWLKRVPLAVPVYHWLRKTWYRYHRGLRLPVVARY